MEIIGEMIDSVIAAILDFTGASANLLKITQPMVNLMMPLWEYFVIAGIGLTICYFIIEMNKKLAFEGSNVTIQSMFIPIFKFIIAIVVFANAARIFGFVIDFGNTFNEWCDNSFDIPLLNDAGVAVDGSALVYSENMGQQLIDSLGFWQKIFMLFPTTITMVVILCCNIVWSYKALLYKAELMIRVGFAPIALADIYSGQNATAVRYLKGTLALVIYGACLILVPKLCQSLAYADLAAFLDAWGSFDFKTGGYLLFDTISAYVKLMIMPIAAIGLTSAARQITKEALGA